MGRGNHFDCSHTQQSYSRAIRKLSNDPTTPNPPCLVNANQVAHQLLINDQGTMPTKPKRTILPPIQEGTPTMAYPFSEEDYRKAIAALKNNKAAGRDDVLVEQLKHLGPRANKCSTYASQETGSPRYGDNPSVSPYSSQRKTPRFRRTTGDSFSYVIRTNYTNE